jgi:hypothetical protein
MKVKVARDSGLSASGASLPRSTCFGVDIAGAQFGSGDEQGFESLNSNPKSAIRTASSLKLVPPTANEVEGSVEEDTSERAYKLNEPEDEEEELNG